METITFQEPTAEPLTIDEPVKRRRGRPPKSVQNLTNGDAAPDPKPARTRRASKLSADDVENMVSAGFDLVVLFTQRPYWHVEKAEIVPWSASAAKLLNDIPAKYVNAFVNSSAYFAVGMGMLSILKPRLAADAEVARLKRAGRPITFGPQTEPSQSAPEPRETSENGTVDAVDDLFAEVL